MENIKAIHLLFEQSGTFKRAFRSYGFPAFDYDIQNHYGETDYVTDLFAEIDEAYLGHRSIFDMFDPADLVMAFFPCTYFCGENDLLFSFGHANHSGKVESEVLSYMIKRQNQRADYLITLYKLVAVCKRMGFRMIIENPFTNNFLLRPSVFPYAPSYIDVDRTRRGDDFRKPTMFYFFNCEPSYGFTECQNPSPKRIKHVSSSQSTGVRSHISDSYATLFIKDQILGISDMTDNSLFL